MEVVVASHWYPIDSVFLYPVLQAYIKIYQGEELPHPKSMLQVRDGELLGIRALQLPSIAT